MVSTRDPAEVIRARLKKIGLTQSAFSIRVGKSPGWAAARFLPNPENAIRYFAYKEPETLDRILAVLHWTPEEFSKQTGIDIGGYGIPEGGIPVKRYRLPIIDAGAGLPSWNEDGEFMEIYLPDLRKYKAQNLFMVRVAGDSMAPTYLDKDIVLIQRGEEFRPGSVVAIHIWQDGLVLKRLQKSGDMWMLYSDNSAYPPVPLGEHDHIYGVAKLVIRPAR